MAQGFRLSPQQKICWKYTQECKVDSQCIALDVKGTFNSECAVRALDKIVARHEIFSTAFDRLEGVSFPLQILRSPSIVWGDRIDLPANNREEANQAIREEIKRLSDQIGRIDDSSPKIHANVISLSESRSILVIFFHPLMVDGYAQNVIAKEWIEAYTSFTLNRKPIFEEPLAYIEASEWLNDLVQSEDAEEGLSYWRHYCENFDQVKTSKLTKIENTHIESGVEVSIESVFCRKGLVDSLNNIAVKNKAKLEDLLLAAWSILVDRYEAPNDVIGVCFGGRTDEELESTIGLLSKSLPCSLRLERDKSFLYLLNKVREFRESAEVHQECFCWDVFEEYLSGSEKYIHISYEYEDAALRSEKGEVDVSIFSKRCFTEPVCLKLKTVYDDIKGLELEFQFSESIYPRDFILRMSEQLQTILSEVNSDYDKPISDINILPKHQLEELLIHFNNVERATTSDKSFVELFEDQVESRPESISLITDKETLTYGELNSQANALSHELIRLGANPGTIVGVCCNRSSEAVIAILAIFKAGCVYLPLDPSYPEDRINFMLEDSGVNTILTKNENASLFDSTKYKLVMLDRELEINTANTPVSYNYQPEDSAYIIYTSGSTGKPKGTVVSHKALINHCCSVRENYQLNARDRVLLFAPFNFDPSLEQCLPGLITGSTVMVSPQQAWSVTELSEKINSYKLTVVNFPTAYWNLLVQEWESNINLSHLGTLRLLISGGDKMLLDNLQRWRSLGLSHVRLLNAYGPTEATVTTTIADNLQREIFSYSDVPIGRPLANRKTYILDNQLNPVPIECHGELYIGGMSLADGYLGRPDMTNERFLSDPFSSDPHARIYKTGDRAFFSADGEIYFLGRDDVQIKVNGFRVELSEIENAISQIENVKETAVVARSLNNETDDKYLYAFYVNLTEGSINGAIGEHIKTVLPTYMLPTEIREIAELPLLPNGKVDRKALELMASGPCIQEQSQLEEVLTETQDALVKVWKVLFDKVKVNLHDNFFDIGGHSLIAMKLLSRIRQEFSVDITLQEVFSSENLGEMSALIDRKRGESTQKNPFVIYKDDGSPKPLSFGQERFWFLNEMGYGLQYHMSGFAKVVGYVDQLNLQNAIDLLVERHTTLRSIFKKIDNQLRVLVNHNLRISLDQITLKNQANDETVSRVLKDWIERPFHLEDGDVVRIVLLEVSESEYIIGLCVHHIVADGLSIGILIREMSEIYNSLLGGEPLNLKNQRAQYSDFAIWQRKALDNERDSELIAFWQDRLNRYQNLALPTDFPRPKNMSGRGACKIITFERPVIQSLMALCKEIHVNFFSALTSAVYLVLSRYSSQSDICFGMPVSNRSFDELEDIVGMFVNTIALRVSPSSGQTTVVRLLQDVHKEIYEAQDHQELPFERLVDEIKAERDPSRNPIFQVLISHIKPERCLQFGGASGVPYHLDYATARFDLAFDFEEDDDGELSLLLEYSTELFREESVDRLIDCLSQCFKEITLKYQNSIDSLVIVDQRHQSELIEIGMPDSSQSLARLHTTTTFLQLFKQGVEANPGKLAIAFGGEDLSYSELDKLSNVIALELGKSGVCQGDYVGVCVSRSINMVVGILGVLKAGAAYIPLDPTYPNNRLKYIIEGSGLSLILSEYRLMEKVTCLVNKGVSILTTENLLNACDDESYIESLASTTIPRQKPDDVAYVMYTSGSTGKPKGVVVTHGNVTNFLLSMSEVPGFSPSDKLLSVTTYCFDISILELFLPLVNGGECYLCSEDDIRNGERLLKQINRVQPTVMQATPATWTMLFQLGWRNEERIKLLCGGEALSDSLKTKFVESTSEVWNMYGPTETTVWSTLCKVDKDWRNMIGRPIHNTELLVLDKALNLVPFGGLGELYIGGRGVASGYFENTVLTEERFIINPFDPESIVYKTGDLVRWVPGVYGHKPILEYHGRIDSQVKYRGYRVELEEIEKEILGLDCIRDVCVVITANQQLAAFFLRKSRSHEMKKADIIGVIKARCKENLPSYMVPSHYTELDNIPLTPNGKTDRKLLVNYPIDNEGSEEKSDSLDTTTEKRLSKIWEDVLNIKTVGKNDDFFSLGGHSLLIIMLQNRISQEFGRKIGIDILFNNPLLQQMANKIDSSESNSRNLQKIKVNDTPENPPLSFAQQGLWLVEQIEQGTTAYNVPSAVRVTGKIDLQKLLVSFDRVSRRHEVLNSCFDFVDGQAVQMVRKPGKLSIPVIDLSTSNREDKVKQIRTHIEEDLDHHFNLSTGPIWRVRILVLSEDEHIILINMHHICTDGWSMELLIRELKTFYLGLLASDDFHLPALDLQYKDYAFWQRNNEHSDEFTKHYAYWVKNLKGVKAISPLPFDKSHPELRSFKGSIIYFEIPDKIREGTSKYADDHKVTEFMVLLSVYKILLSIETGEKDILVGTDVANRSSSDLEKLIGFFVNQLPIRTYLDSQSTLKDIVEDVSHSCLEAYAHQEVPFEQLLKHQKIARSTKYSPLFQTKFFMEQRSQNDVTIADLEFDVIPMESQPARLDLTVGLVEENNKIKGSIVYNNDLFSVSTIRRMEMRYLRILEIFLADKNRRLCDLKDYLLSLERSEKILVGSEIIKNKIKSFDRKSSRKPVTI